jgi:hypothetical protein
MNREDVLSILKPAKPEVRPITLPDGAQVYVRRMGLDEVDRWNESARGKDGKYAPDWRAKFLVCVLCDEDGRRLFDDGDWALLKHVPNAHADIVFDEAYVWNCGDAKMLALLKNVSEGEAQNGSASPSVSQSALSILTTSDAPPKD